MNIENLTATENISGSWAAFINFTFNTVTVNTIAEESRNDDTRLRIIQLYVQPIVGISGMVANILTFGMLIKSGLKKPSNIIIFGLTLADCFLVISPINVVEFTARFLHSKETANYFGWECSENLARFLFILNRVLTTLHYWGGFAGTSLPVMITMERFIAVFFPIKFASIVTSKKAFLVVVSVWFSIVPVSVVTFGCILIGVRVKNSYLQRQLSLAKKRKRPSLKTTRTLVAIALIFATIHGTYFIMTCAMVDQYLNHTAFSIVFDEIKLILVYVCGSCNFFVYVLINNKFSKILMNMFCKR
ncbi:G-protein coupled receptor [Biomphalaria pfeifferi]|uniref:G-protein coupled receptor n=1 Tax=Biomphalaria pfeifferi TaxID=112525 RepID=A0AAD8BRN3_BIOPF|nr:G-protein coupled receptor [Biomphalaria pfeifferi]